MSSTKYIPYGHRTDTSNFQWVPSIRYVRRGHDASATGEWRSSVHCAIPRLGGEEKFPVRPHRRVTGGTTYRHSIETCEGEFKTSLRYIPEFQPPCKNWQSSKSHVTASRTKFCTVCPAEVPTNSHLKSILDETCEKWTVSSLFTLSSLLPPMEREIPSLISNCLFVGHLWTRNCELFPSLTHMLYLCSNAERG